MSTTVKKGRTTNAAAQTEKIARLCANCALDKKAVDLAVLYVGEVSSFADYFVVCTGTSARHVIAIAASVREGMKKAGVSPLGVEGERAGNWVLLDYGDVVTHVFSAEARRFYDLEGLWGFVPTMRVENEVYSIPRISLTPRRVAKRDG